jgi:hypothetical protein
MWARRSAFHDGATTHNDATGLSRIDDCQERHTRDRVQVRCYQVPSMWQPTPATVDVEAQRLTSNTEMALDAHSPSSTKRHSDADTNHSK